MRYYFHLESETNIHIDHLGREFTHAEDVEAHAATLAHDLGRDDRWLGWSVRVIGAHNMEVLCVPVADVLVRR